MDGHSGAACGHSLEAVPSFQRHQPGESAPVTPRRKGSMSFGSSAASVSLSGPVSSEGGSGVCLANSPTPEGTGPGT